MGRLILGCPNFDPGQIDHDPGGVSDHLRSRLHSIVGGEHQTILIGVESPKDELAQPKQGLPPATKLMRFRNNQ
jgi:hypothetical protein